MNGSSRKDGFVPTYLLERWSEEGSREAAETLDERRVLREEIDSFARSGAELERDRDDDGRAERMIFDCRNVPKIRNNLVRGEGQPPTHDEDVNAAYDNAGHTLDYFKNVLGRNSVDDRGHDLRFYVNYGRHYGNAEWIPETKIMIFGDADGRQLTGFVKSLEVVAHELTHGITQHVNGLRYTFQSGALDEHFSDAIGSAVKQRAKGQTAETADWLMGDEIVGPEFKGVALRSLKAPGTAMEDDPQPSHMDGFKDTGKLDNRGVHINCGIPNKAFYLTALEIGTDSAAFLWYTAWKDKTIMKPDAAFSDAFESILKAAGLLANQGKLPEIAVKAVKESFRAVGVYSLASV